MNLKLWKLLTYNQQLRIFRQNKLALMEVNK